MKVIVLLCLLILGGCTQYDVDVYIKMDDHSQDRHIYPPPNCQIPGYMQ